MSPVVRLCKHGTRTPPACQQCKRERNQKRTTRNRDTGRNTAHWQQLSKLARQLTTHCATCGRRETEADPFTVDLVGGGDHSVATLEQTRVRHNSCHVRLHRKA